MMNNMSYVTAVAKASLLIELGQTDITLYREDEPDFPYDKVVSVEAGSSWRLSGPSSARLIAHEAGLKFILSVDFEGHDANGRGVSLFDRDKLRDLMMKLPDEARQSFADMLETQVLQPLKKRTDELRLAMREQADSEDCVRGLIAFAREGHPQ
jgi:hypothetical protein